MMLRHYIRSMLADTLFATGFADPRRIPASRFTIVSLHRVLRPEQIAEYPLTRLAVTPAFLNELCEYFAQHFHCVTVTVGMKAMQDPSSLSKPLLAVTFDDGRMDNFEQAAPILNRHNIPATFYVPAGSVGTDELLWHDDIGYSVAHLFQQREIRSLEEIFGHCIGNRSVNCAAHQAADFAKPLSQESRLQLQEQLTDCVGKLSVPAWEGSMGWLELNQLLEMGHEIGSHSMTHSVLGNGRCDEQTYEINGSRNLLNRQLGTSINSFSYPTGGLDESTVETVRQCDYRSAVTTEEGFNVSSTDPFRLSRFNVQQSQNEYRGGNLNPAILSCRLTNLLGAR